MITDFLEFKISIIIIYSIFTVIRVNSRRIVRKHTKIVKKEINSIDQLILYSFIFYELITFGFYLFSDFLNWGSYAPVIWLSWIGVSIGVLSLLLFLWVHISLGKYFSYKIQITENQPLIQEGPYKYVRHPMYIAFFLLHISVFLVTSNWFIGITWIGGLFFFLYTRIQKEENILHEHFGKAYEDYSAKTGRFLPKLFGNKIKD